LLLLVLLLPKELLLRVWWQRVKHRQAKPAGACGQQLLRLLLLLQPTRLGPHRRAATLASPRP
jgi:hypothetical protein